MLPKLKSKTTEVYLYVSVQFELKKVSQVESQTVKQKLSRCRKMGRARFAPSRTIIVRALFDTGKPCEHHCVIFVVTSGGCTYKQFQN